MNEMQLFLTSGLFLFALVNLVIVLIREMTKK